MSESYMHVSDKWTAGSNAQQSDFHILAQKPYRVSPLPGYRRYPGISATRVEPSCRGPVSLHSCRQGGVTISSAEAEYVAASAAAQEVIYLRSLEISTFCPP